MGVINPKTGKRTGGALEFFKKLILQNDDLAAKVDEVAKTTNRKSPEWTKTLEEFSVNRMESLKRQIIESDRSPDTIFNAVAKTFRIPTRELRQDVTDITGFKLKVRLYKTL
jgi:hypothetical protein